MKKALGIIILTAFSVGLVAETACEIHSLATGQAVTASTAIELIVCWGVVLAVFIAAIVKGFLGSASWLGVGVAVHHDDSDDDDYYAENASEDEATDDVESTGEETTDEETPSDETPSEENPENNAQ